MKKTAKRSLIFVLALLITGVMTCSDSFAYFQRGSVGVYAGQSSVSVSQGRLAAVSLSLLRHQVLSFRAAAWRNVRRSAVRKTVLMRGRM